MVNQEPVQKANPKETPKPEKTLSEKLLSRILQEVKTTGRWVAFMGIVMIIGLVLSVLVGLTSGIDFLGLGY